MGSTPPEAGEAGAGSTPRAVAERDNRPRVVAEVDRTSREAEGWDSRPWAGGGGDGRHIVGNRAGSEPAGRWGPDAGNPTDYVSRPKSQPEL